MNFKSLTLGALAAIALPFAASAVTVQPTNLPVAGAGGSPDQVFIDGGRTVSIFNEPTVISDTGGTPISVGFVEFFTISFDPDVTPSDGGPNFVRIDFTSLDGLPILASIEFAENSSVLGDAQFGIGFRQGTDANGVTTTAELNANGGTIDNVALVQGTGTAPDGVLAANSFDNFNAFPPAEILFTDGVPNSQLAFYVIYDGIALGEDAITLEVTISAVPVPAGLVLMLTALGGLGFVGRYRSKLAAAA